jgi:hypothetical protein
MDLNKVQGRQVVRAVSENRESRNPGADSEIHRVLEDAVNDLVFQDISEEIQALYVWLNKTIRCIMFEQYRAYLKCPVCPEYIVCAQITRQQRIELETSPFFSIKEITWEGPRRIKNMFIAVCTDGSLRRLDNFDPKDTDVVNLDQYKDVEEVLVVTKAFRRKVMWAPVPLEQVNASRDNGANMKKSENLIEKENVAVLSQRQAPKEDAKPKNGKKNNTRTG